MTIFSYFFFTFTELSKNDKISLRLKTNLLNFEFFALNMNRTKKTKKKNVVMQHQFEIRQQNLRGCNKLFSY